ncbi:hypothetical protein Trydic_g16569 [Trypoxylus dichotomus]
MPAENEIPNEALKNLPLKLFVNLTTIFNAVLHLTPYASGCKSARIIPVLKPKKDHHSPEGSQRISINDCLDENHRLDYDQLEFRSGHSTTLQLFRIADHVITAFNKKQTAVMVSLDLKKAFDKIRHKGLLLKMKDCDFPVGILKILR